MLSDDLATSALADDLVTVNTTLGDDLATVNFTLSKIFYISYESGTHHLCSAILPDGWMLLGEKSSWTTRLQHHREAIFSAEPMKLAFLCNSVALLYTCSGG